MSTKLTLKLPSITNEKPISLSLNLPKPPPLTLSLPTAESYKQYDQRTHVYMKPDMYIGSVVPMNRTDWLYDYTNKKMISTNIDFVPGAERIFLEILTNASDNVGRSRRAGIDPGELEITMDRQYISVTNYGLPIPIEIHPKEKVYVPQMIFGNMLTGSNYEVERHEVGTNGIGAKAANIFSKEFKVEIIDAPRQLSYVQTWAENMTIRSDPIITPTKKKESSVKITYKMDFARFGYSLEGYPPEAFALFYRHAFDISFTAKVNVTFNGEKINCCNIRDYARLYFGEAVETGIAHYQWPADTEVITKRKGYQVAKNPSITPEVEIFAMDTPDSGLECNHVSFVNCMMTKDGGVHVNAAIKAVGDSAVQMINESMIKKLTKFKKGKEIDAKEKRAHTITINDVKPHISIIVSVRVRNPMFTSQTKTVLSSPVPKIKIDEEELKGINRWQLIDRLYAALDAKQALNSTKTDGKTKRHLKLEKGTNANYAGSKDRHQCVLYITEGQSGAAYANNLVALIKTKRDYIGVLPMKGKSLNVMNADFMQIDSNKEINELKKMLGLRAGANYLEPANFNHLNYGAVMIMADSDVDGKHIIGLILNFFHCKFPSLLARGYIMYYRTPTISVIKGKTKLRFYTQSEYDQYKAQNPEITKWTHKYYKGLGSSSNPEIKEDFDSPRYVKCLYDEKAPEAMKLAFDKKLSDQRKEWINNWKEVLGVDQMEMQPISLFINHEFILFSIADVQRSIPNIMDGFKESHRKIIHAAIKKWNIGTKGKEAKKQIKIAQLGSNVAETTKYHHGETILSDVIIGMGQDFTGSNNVPWFTQDGQFGCVDPNTPILLWNGSVKSAKEITMNDILIGDDGQPRHISKIVQGEDHMYDIIQKQGITYRVNSKHILTLRFEKQDQFYYDVDTKTVKLQDDNKIINDNDIFDIDVGTYLSFPKNIQNLFSSVPYKEHLGSDPIIIRYAGIGNYVGWYLDGNERFLLGDFTVTHNTRYEGGKDKAASRYPSTRPEKLFPYIIRKEDKPLLKLIIDEGEEVEPESFYPIIPMLLINGSQGIGTGYSTFIPNHNPLDIIAWIRKFLVNASDEEYPEVLPWYRGFKGVIRVIDRSHRKRTNKVKITEIKAEKIKSSEIEAGKMEESPVSEDINNEEVEEEEPTYDRELLSMESVGDFHIKDDGTIVITELPIGRWPKNYDDWLHSLLEVKKIADYKNNSAGNEVYFEIVGFTEPPTHANLRLKRTFGMSNMVMLMENKRPQRFDTVYQILHAFCTRRLPIYQQRKDYILNELKSDIVKLYNLARFIRAIKDGEIVVINRRKNDIREDMKRLDIPVELLEVPKVVNCTQEDIEDLLAKIASKENEIKILENTTPAQMWSKELDELERVYCNHFKIKLPNGAINFTLPNDLDDEDQDFEVTTIKTTKPVLVLKNPVTPPKLTLKLPPVNQSNQSTKMPPVIKLNLATK